MRARLFRQNNCFWRVQGRRRACITTGPNDEHCEIQTISLYYFSLTCLHSLNGDNWIQLSDDNNFTSPLSRVSDVWMCLVCP